MPRGDLAHITREKLAPVWARLDIPLDRIAASLGVTRQGLVWKAERLGLPSRARNHHSLANESEFRAMWLAGVALDDMVVHFGYASRSSVTSRARSLGLPRRRSGSPWIIPRITVGEYREQKLGEAMRRAA